jgi:hypothetical protein
MVDEPQRGTNCEKVLHIAMSTPSRNRSEFVGMAQMVVKTPTDGGLMGWDIAGPAKRHCRMRRKSTFS